MATYRIRQGYFRGTKDKIKPSRANWSCVHCDTRNPEERGTNGATINLRLNFCLACYKARDGKPQVRKVQQ